MNKNVVSSVIRLAKQNGFTVALVTAINAHTGCIVPLSDGSELWCDEEALCKNNPVRNAMASLLAKQDIYGDVILFKKGDIK